MAASPEKGSAALEGSILIAGVGSLQGVGAAIARRFGREGYPVVIAGRNTEKLLATRDTLKRMVSAFMLSQATSPIRKM